MPFKVPDSWFSGCDFTTDWSSRAFDDWSEHLGHLRKDSINILEIGAWEGRGSLFFLNFFSKSKLTALDIFSLGNEGRFDANVLDRFPTRATKVKGRSTVELDRFAAEGKTFDLIYLDGSHLRDDVMIDSILAWRLLNVGGYLIWDDYELIKAMPGHFNHADQDPKPAIDVFTGWHADEMHVVHRAYQVIVQKTSPHYQEVIPNLNGMDESSSDSHFGLEEARQKIQALRDRLADSEAAVIAERVKLDRSDKQLRQCQQEFREKLIILGQAQSESAFLKKELEKKDSEVAKLRERLSSSEVSSRKLFDDLNNSLREAMEKQRNAEAAVVAAEEALARRFRELAILTKLLGEQELDSMQARRQLDWVLRVREKTANQPAWWGVLPLKMRRRREYERLRRGGLFDARSYLAKNRDVAESGIDPLDHYLRHGLAEGRPL